MSFASKTRKNKQRAISAVEKMQFSKMGRKMDLIFRTCTSSHSIPLEFGASETGKLMEGNHSTKFMEEGFVKLPKTLKDMLDQLIIRSNYDNDIMSKLRVVGLVHSGLSSTLLQADRPSRYITRIIRFKTLHVSDDINTFFQTVIPTLCSAIVVREIVKESLNLVNSQHESDNEDWLDNCLTSTSSTIISETSSSPNRYAKKTKYSC